MTQIIEMKRKELKKIQILINRITKNPSRKMVALSTESKKMVLATLDSLSARKSQLLSEIISLS